MPMGKRNESWITCIIFKYKYGLDCEIMINNALKCCYGSIIGVCLSIIV